MNKKFVLGLTAIMLCLAAMALCPDSAMAAPFIWNGGNGNWETAANWTPPGVPGIYDDVVILGGAAYTVTINSDVNVKSVTVGPGPTLQISASGSLSVCDKLELQANSTLTSQLLVNGKLTVADGGRLEVARIGSAYAVLSVDSGGTLDNYGRISNDGLVNVFNNGFMSNHGVIDNLYNIHNQGTIFNYGKFNNTSSLVINNQGEIWSNEAIAGNISPNPVGLFEDKAKNDLNLTNTPKRFIPMKTIPAGTDKFDKFKEYRDNYGITDYYAIYEPAAVKIPADPITIGAGLTFTVNLISGAVTVPDALAEILANFTITKVFPTGDVLDLLKLLDPLLGKGVITYSVNLLSQTATLTIIPAIVINDGPPPAGSQTVIRPYPGAKCGIDYFSFAGSWNYLLIFDGEEDGVIADPIALMDRAVADALIARNGTRGDSGGGCDAGVGLFGLLIPLAALAATKRGRRK